jgi:hypothetical protein
VELRCVRSRDKGGDALTAYAKATLLGFRSCHCLRRLHNALFTKENREESQDFKTDITLTPETLKTVLSNQLAGAALAATSSEPGIFALIRILLHRKV